MKSNDLPLIYDWMEYQITVKIMLDIVGEERGNGRWERNMSTTQ